MSSLKKFDIGIVGAGGAGVPMAAMASKVGLRVALFADAEHRSSNFDDLVKQAFNNGIPFDQSLVTSDGVVTGSYKVALIDDLQVLVNNCNQLWNNLPEPAHDQFITNLERVDNLGSVIIGTVTANGFSLKARNRIHPRGFIDGAVSPTASRAAKGNAYVAGVKEGMYTGLFPRDLPLDVLDYYHRIYAKQDVRILPNSFAAILVNTNLFIHAQCLLLALALIENSDKLSDEADIGFYYTCLASRFGNRAATNAGRYFGELLEAMGMGELLSGVDLSNFYYKFNAKNLGELGAKLPAYNAKSFLPALEGIEKNRYLREDPAVNNMVATVAAMFDVSPRKFWAYVDSVGMAIDDDYEPVNDDLSGIDMKGYSKEQLLAAINEPKASWDQRWEDGLEQARVARAKKYDGPTLNEYLSARIGSAEAKQKWARFLADQF